MVDEAPVDEAPVDDAPLDEAPVDDEPVPPPEHSLAHADRAPDAWALSRSGNETDPALIAKLDALVTDEDVHLPARDRVSNPFEAIERSTTAPLPEPAVIGPHAAPPLIGGTRDETPGPLPEPEPVPFDDATVQDPSPVYPAGVKAGARPAPQPAAVKQPTEAKQGGAQSRGSAESSDLILKVGIAAVVVFIASLLIVLLVVIASHLTAT